MTRANEQPAASRVSLYVDTRDVLVEHGFDPLPIEPGTKAPANKAWTTAPPPIAGSYPRCYTGIRTGTGKTPVAALDIDVRDAALIEHILDLARIRVTGGKWLLRYGRAPRVLIPFRMAGTFSKMATPKYYFPGETKSETFKGSAAEILAAGQQFVAIAIHPQTKRPYYTEGGEFLSTSVAQLPLLDESTARAILDDCEDVFRQAGGKAEGKAHDANREPASDALLLTPLVARNPAQLAAILRAGFVPNDDVSWDEWVRIGNAIKGAFADDAIGSELFDEFSAKSPKYDAEKTESQWRTFKPRDLGAGTLYYIAKQNGYVGAMNEPDNAREASDAPDLLLEPMTLEDMYAQLVYIEQGSGIARLDQPAVALGFEHALRKYAANKQPSEGRAAPMPTLRAWNESQRRKTVTCRGFAAGEPEIYTDDFGCKVLNLYRATPHIAPDNWEALAAPFLHHIAFLVPDEAEREWFLDWLAHIQQRPGQLPHTHALMIARVQGIGRSWLGDALRAVWPGYVATGVHLDTVLGSTFNDAIGGKLLVTVDELREGGEHKFREAQKLKSLLTETTRRINRKFEPPYEERNSIRWLMFSNHDDALPITHSDRRIRVIANPDAPKPASYYTRIYGLLRDEPNFAPAIREYLRRRNIAGFNPGALPPLSRAKLQVIAASQSEMVLAARDLVADWPNDCISSGDAMMRLAPHGTAKAASYALRDAGATTYDRQVKIGKESRRVWILRRCDLWLEASPAQIAFEVSRDARNATSRDADPLA